MKPSVLITRPREQAEETAKTLRQMGFESFIHPVLAIKADADGLAQLAAESLADYAGAIITSKQVEKILAEEGITLTLPIFGIGQEARDAQALVKHLRQHVPKGGTLLYLRGADISFPLKEELAKSGIKVAECIIYRAEIERLTPEMETLLLQKQAGISLHYSKRSADAFLALAASLNNPGILSAMDAIAISPAVKEALQPGRFRRIVAAETPDESAMLRLLRSLYS